MVSAGLPSAPYAEACQAFMVGMFIADAVVVKRAGVCEGTSKPKAFESSGESSGADRDSFSVVYTTRKKPEAESLDFGIHSNPRVGFRRTPFFLTMGCGSSKATDAAAPVAAAVTAPVEAPTPGVTGGMDGTSVRNRPIGLSDTRLDPMRDAFLEGCLDRASFSVA